MARTNWKCACKAGFPVLEKVVEGMPAVFQTGVLDRRELVETRNQRENARHQWGRNSAAHSEHV